jgi:rhodanese-related sulfurtransferase
MPLPYRQQMANRLTSKELRERQDEYTYVDVREADELEEGMIKGATFLLTSSNTSHSSR